MKVSLKIKGLELNYNEGNLNKMNMPNRYNNNIEANFNIEEMEVSTELTNDEFKDYAKVVIEVFRETVAELQRL